MKPTKDIILSIREVEPGLTHACRKLEKKLGRKLRGICLVPVEYANNTSRSRDETGFFEEIICDFNSESDLQNKLKQFQHEILAVNCRFETAVQKFIKVIPFIPYVDTPNESSLKWAIEKSYMRDRLRDYDEKLVPRYKNITRDDLTEINSLINTMNFPVIIKPNGLNSSILVTKCRNGNELKSNLINTFNIIDEIYYKERGAGNPSVLIEEFIVGDMYSIDAYVSPKGEVTCLPPVRVITSHDVGLDGFYGYQFELPSNLTDTEINKANEAAIKSIYALNLRSCTAHIELYNCSGNWKIIELGPRIGGHREDMYREAFAIDHYYNDLASRIGLPLELPAKNKSIHTICMDLYPEKEGIITSFEGFEEVKKLESFKHVKKHANIGDKALFAHNGGPYIVDVLLANSNLDTLVNDAGMAREFIKIAIDN